MEAKKTKIIIIVGPTASGKTALALDIAKEYLGEIISADSRQVYTGLDIGTEKITPDEMEGVPHHLIDNTTIDTVYSTADWKRDAAQAIKDITYRKALPIVVGGTFFYVEALLGRKSVPEVPPNEKLRKRLEAMSVEALAKELKKKDPARAATIDLKNPRRLVRALEIVEALGVVPEAKDVPCPYDAHLIGMETTPEELKARIEARLYKTLHRGLINEVKALKEKGVSEVRLAEIGLEYRVVLEHLRGEMSQAEMVKRLQEKVWQYAKRQRTWLKKMEGITWYRPGETERILKDVGAFLKK